MKILSNSLWDELVRRRVVRTGAAYAVASFVTLQLGEIMLPAYGVGQDGMRALIAALMGGCPLVLAGSWVYDITVPAIHRTPRREPAVAGGRRAPASKRAIGAVIGAAVLLGAAGWWLVGGALGSGTLLATLPSLLASAAVLFALAWCSMYGASQDVVQPTSPSIAVLPFACWGRDQDADVGEALADEIRNRLQKGDWLDVAARISSPNGEALPDARNLGRKLGVTTLLEGSVLRYGAKARVNAQLIDARTGFRLWSRTYVFDVDGSLAAHDEIACAVVEQILGGQSDLRPLRAV